MHAPICSLLAQCSTRWLLARCPFAGKARGLVFESVLNRAPVPPVRLNPDLPADLDRIIDKGLEKDRDLRYQHAADIRADLQRLKRDSENGHSFCGNLWHHNRDPGCCNPACEGLEDRGFRPVVGLVRGGRALLSLPSANKRLTDKTPSSSPTSLTARAIQFSTTR